MDTVVYIDTDMSTGPYPFPIGLCLTKSAWDKEMKRLDITEAPWYEDSDHTRTFVDKHPRSIICLAHLPRINSLAHQVEVIAHESTHAWQRMMDFINEEHPGREQEAYMIGWISGWVFFRTFGDYKPLRMDHG